MSRYIYTLLILLLISCSETVSDCRQLSVTMEPYRYIVEAVAGDNWCVRSVVAKGANPETFDPTPSDILALSDSEVYFMVGGLGFEDAWKSRIADIHPDLRIVDTSIGVNRDKGDPHLWTSPDNVSIIAENICETLCRLDTLSAAYYRRRLGSFKKSVQRTDSIITCKLRDCRSRAFLIFHPSLTYFSNRYGLSQIAIEHDGKEPSVFGMKSVTDSARLYGVKYILVQAEFDTRNAQAIANELGMQVVEIDPLNYDWHGEMLHIAEILSR